MRHDRAKAAAVMHKIRNRQILVAHHHDVVVEPGLIDRRKTRIVERFDIAPGDLAADLRPHAADLDHRSFLPSVTAKSRPALQTVSTGRMAMVAMRRTR